MFTYQVNEKPVWKEGDFARIVFPNKSRDNLPEGVLLTDEFTDEMNETCVIFCPVENDILLTEFAVKIPVKLLEGISY